MGATDRSAQLDGAWLERAKRIGKVWLILEGRVDDRMEKDEMDTFKVSFKKRVGGWLMIVEGVVGGQKMVQFKDMGDISEAGESLRSLLEEPKWRVSKPFTDNVVTGGLVKGQ